MNVRVWYLSHSGFAVETANSVLVFDYFRDEPEGGGLGQGVVNPLVWAEKRVAVFVSHHHDDHYNPVVLQWRNSIPNIRYILSGDIPAVPYAVMAAPNETIRLDGLTVKTYRSTDEGVAFLVNSDGLTVFHSGDLNWWHWEGEPDEDNRQMAVDYQAEIDRLAGEKINLAFVPLDPRQEQQYDWGMRYFLTHVQAQYVFPMHFWDQPEVIDRLLAAPDLGYFAGELCPLKERGQHIDLTVDTES